MFTKTSITVRTYANSKHLKDIESFTLQLAYH